MNIDLLRLLESRLPPNAKGKPPEFVTAASPNYEVIRQVNNTKFQFKPSAIVLVETSAQVSEIVRFANKFPTEIVLRVRSGGHDHEGECSGTDTLLLDFSKMNTVEVKVAIDCGGTSEPIVVIGPGARFKDIKPLLDKKNIGIAHGTCETVGIAGYTMGGGWGPWTRRHGMGCERLIGATIVLGDGQIKTIGYGELANCEAKDLPEADRKLMWALRGGGGLSYGIVTQLRFRAFYLPKNLCSFNLSCNGAWPQRSTREILHCWEKAIRDKENPRLLGTNLKVIARHLKDGAKANPEAVLNCTFNGYFEGTAQEVVEMIKKYFVSDKPNERAELVIEVIKNHLIETIGKHFVFDKPNERTEHEVIEMTKKYLIEMIEKCSVHDEANKRIGQQVIEKPVIEQKVIETIKNHLIEMIEMYFVFDKPNERTEHEVIETIKKQLIEMIEKYFVFEKPHDNDDVAKNVIVQVHRRLEGSPATVLNARQWHFDSWDRHVASKVKRLAAGPDSSFIDPGIVLEEDGPAPRKITSRLADAGWDDNGRKALICSMQSPMVPEVVETECDGPANDFKLSAYVTIGAISGPFYASYGKQQAAPLPSAFPYKDRLFTIQYQAWWDQYLNAEGKPKEDIESIERDVLANRPCINLAEDWIEACRDYPIPHTGGDFISFKDSAVRTETYFDRSYKDLREVKETYSKDKNLLFRTRKTII